jgi:hypothetical protein
MAMEALLLCESLLQQNNAIDWSVAAAALQNSALVARGSSFSPDVRPVPHFTQQNTCVVLCSPATPPRLCLFEIRMKIRRRRF